jgi:hypothetical protein
MKRFGWLVFLAACTAELGPQEPVWGKQQCGHCAMLVSERAPSAQLVREDGARLFFDDVGCMVSWVAREKAVPKAQWVRVGEGWAIAETAHFQRAHTPMDFGFVGAPDGVDWQTVRAEVLAKGRPEVAQ